MGESDRIRLAKESDRIRLTKECGREDFVYVDMWEHFVGKLDYFAKDGLHIHSWGIHRLCKIQVMSV